MVQGELMMLPICVIVCLRDVTVASQFRKDGVRISWMPICSRLQLVPVHFSLCGINSCFYTFFAMENVDKSLATCILLVNMLLAVL